MRSELSLWSWYVDENKLMSVVLHRSSLLLRGSESCETQLPVRHIKCKVWNAFMVLSSLRKLQLST